MSDTQSQWQSDLFWGAVLGAAVVYEVHAIKREHLNRTLTRTTRRAFRTQHPWGKTAFAIGWGYTAVWFLRHILEFKADEPVELPEPFSMFTEPPWSR